jgi:hypothetical protein
MKTNLEKFSDAKNETIKKINALPETFTQTNMETFLDETIETGAAKIELTAVIANISTFTPAFSPIDNVRYGLHKCSQIARDVFEKAVWEG